MGGAFSCSRVWGYAVVVLMGAHSVLEYASILENVAITRISVPSLDVLALGDSIRLHL